MRGITSIIPLLLCLFAIGNQPSAQEFELGLMGGVSLYSGDLSPDEFGLYFEDLNPAGGAYIRYRPTSRLALRFQGMFTQLSATDNAPIPGDVDERQERLLNFRSNLTEFSLTAELDLFYIGDKDDNHLAPYVYGGGSIISFNPEGNLDGNWVELQPLATEGQGIQGNPNYDPARYSLNEIVLNVGGGLRWRVSEKFVLGLEIGGRRVASDYLDDVSNTQVDYLDILENTGSQAAEFSNPNIANPTDVRGQTYTRGGEFADWFFHGGLTVGITLGEGSSNGKTGCYEF
ncbi:hypothetical protein CEQ90_10240 [Lewinellaceae bacterium SD302]|nr:hypothetical protein CEQ90_10240 [Lewinellaceae bacterium SD302]